VVLIDAAGPAFSSGYDITPDMSGRTPPGGWVSEALYDEWTDQFARSCLQDWLVIWDLMKPVVAKLTDDDMIAITAYIASVMP